MLSPLLLLVALTIAIRSRRSPLIAHYRSGRFGEPLWMLKFRTMWDVNALRRKGSFRLVEYMISEPESKAVEDPRVTSRFARFLRRHSIDELPQLVHVASGRMAIIGPRPLTPTELETHYQGFAHEVLEAKPGLTGLWQVMGRSKLTYLQRRRLDLFLVRHRSVALRCLILWRTIPLILSGKNAW